MRHRLDRAHRQRRERLARRLLHVGLVEQATLGALAAEEHVLDDVEVVGQREVLVDDLDPEFRGFARALDVHRLALEQDLTRVGRVDARDALDQRRLARAVVADEGRDLAGVDVEVDVVQDVHGAEALVDAAQLENRLAHWVSSVVTRGERRGATEAHPAFVTSGPT
ncbi:hypothetical protein GCM10011609_73280 [Lentzea pudingi]|uniref:Uncharacterized protein n=1 Tax=Lentzea pudingi TaxID=1789439 RepID=A0ABQ2IPG8_9PSEU|nr:hypothetical protein GCM10011609_73280 [Lentzea pudingi]